MYRNGSYDQDMRPTPYSGATGAPIAATAPTDASGKTLNLSGDDDVLILRGKVDYKVTDDIVISVSQTYEDEDSDVSTSYTRNTTDVSLRQTF